MNNKNNKSKDKIKSNKKSKNISNQIYDVLENASDNSTTVVTKTINTIDDEIDDILKSVNNQSQKISLQTSKINDTQYNNEQYKKRINQTPLNGQCGKWTNNRGKSTFVPNNTKLKRLLNDYNTKGIYYKNGVPDFSTFSKGTVQIFNIHGGADGRRFNFSNAYRELSKQTGLSIPELKKMVKTEKLTWHECSDMKTMQLIPTTINSNFVHTSRVGEINLYFDLLEGKLK